MLLLVRMAAFSAARPHGIFCLCRIVRAASARSI